MKVFPYRFPSIVSAFFPRFHWKGGDTRKIYLTFDDGPDQNSTFRILDLLKSYNVKATFFCVGEQVKDHSDAFFQIIEEGHQVGNHTYDHCHGWKMSAARYMQSTSLYDEIAQVSSILFRPPYGKFTLQQYVQLAEKYKVVMWSLMTRDFDKTQSPDQCLQICQKLTKGGDIVVFHDHYKLIAKLEHVLPEYILWCRSQGLEFSLI